MKRAATPTGLDGIQRLRVGALEQCLRMPSRVSKLRFRPSKAG
jgi:hypothetical protein